MKFEHDKPGANILRIRADVRPVEGGYNTVVLRKKFLFMGGRTLCVQLGPMEGSFDLAEEMVINEIVVADRRVFAGGRFYLRNNGTAGLEIEGEIGRFRQKAGRKAKAA